MSAIGTWIKFVKLDEKGMSTTSDDLMHGEVISVGEQVKIPLKIGSKIVVSTVKKNQDLQEGQTFYYVQENQIMDII